MKTKEQTIGIILFCALLTSNACKQKPAPDESVLPRPEEAFGDAKSGRTYKDSRPGKMSITTAPAGAPNVLFILIDDAGFGQWGTFGGQNPHAESLS